MLMELLSNPGKTDHNFPVYTLRCQQTKAEDYHAGRSASSRIHSRVGPQHLRTATIDYGGQERISRRKDLLWLIARLVKGDNQRIPSWTGLPFMQDVA